MTIKIVRMGLKVKDPRFPMDDRNILWKPDHSINDKAAAGSRVRTMKHSDSIGMSRGCTRNSPYVVVDPGADTEVIGGVRWHTLHFSDKSETLNGALEGMGSTVLLSADAVTTVEDSDGRVVLLGIGDAAFDMRTTQTESLWNSHHMRSNKVIVEDVAKSVGGKEHIKLKGTN